MDYQNHSSAAAVLRSWQLDYPHNPIGDAVLMYAKSKLHTTVGSGECTDLVVGALKEANAKPGDTSVDPYVWGDEVTRVVFPDPPVPGPPEWGAWPCGDIIQFKNSYSLTQ
jgi:hypothetical protein